MTRVTRAIVWSDRAKHDLSGIQDYIAADDPMAAERWIEMLVGAVEMVARLPNSGRVIPELGRPELRELVRGGYRIAYRVESRRITVLAVVEGHMRLRFDRGIKE